MKGKEAIETFVCRFVLYNAVLYGLQSYWTFTDDMQDF